MERISVRHVLIAGAAVLLLAAPASGATSTKEGGSISLVAYSTPKEAYAALIPALATPRPTCPPPTWLSEGPRAARSGAGASDLPAQPSSIASII